MQVAAPTAPPPAYTSSSSPPDGAQSPYDATIAKLISLDASQSTALWEQALEDFYKDHESSTALVPRCGEAAKTRASEKILGFIKCRTQTVSQSEPDCHVVMLALRSCRVFMRERLGIDALLRPEALDLFLSLVKQCELERSQVADAMATEAMRCTNNYLFGRTQQQQEFVDQGGLRTLLSLLAKSASPAFHSAVCVCMSNILYQNPKHSKVLDKENPLPVLVPTLVWLVSAESQEQKLTRSTEVMDLVNQLLKILFILGVSTTKEELSTKDQEMMTQLGCVITKMLFLPNHPRGSYEAKLNVWPMFRDVVNLLTYAPTDLTDFLTANKAIGPLLDILLTQMDVALIEQIAPQGPTLAPILALLLRMTQSSKMAQHAIKEAVFPPDRDIELKKEKQQTQMEFIQRLSSLQIPEEKAQFKAAYERHQKDRSIHPEDAAPGSLRWKLMKLMTSLDSNVKRLATELIFLLCNSDKEEFSRRTGFGNAVALLKMKNFI